LKIIEMDFADGAGFKAQQQSRSIFGINLQAA
jgi:hypothetical protein